MVYRGAGKGDPAMTGFNPAQRQHPHWPSGQCAGCFGPLTLEKTVTRVHILVLRAVLGIVFGVVLTRLFYPDASLIFMIGLCAVLVGLSYLTEYLRRKKR